MVLVQQKTDKVNLVYDTGMEFIWTLEDAYEQKDINKFLSLVSPNFKKDFMELKKRLEESRLGCDSVEIYLHFVSKSQDLKKGASCYNICWIKKFKRRKDSHWCRKTGRVTLELKLQGDRQDQRLLLYDIHGESPFNQEGGVK